MKKAKSDEIAKHQQQIWQIQVGLETYAGLFISTGSDPSEIKSPIGAGLAFERMAKKLGKARQFLYELSVAWGLKT